MIELKTPGEVARIAARAGSAAAGGAEPTATATTRTVRTADRTRAARHTIVVTEAGPRVRTAA